MANQRPHLVVVCTANRCRSPVAAALLERGIERAGLDARVSSAGLMRSGLSVPSEGIAIAADYGLDLRRHRSTQVDSVLVESADLVLGMARSHAREIVAMWPHSWPRTFTYKQFNTWLQEAQLPRHASLGGWLDSAASDRPRMTLIGRSELDDIEDPMGHSDAVWRQVIAEIETETSAILERLAPLLQRRAAPHSVPGVSDS